MQSVSYNIAIFIMTWWICFSRAGNVIDMDGLLKRLSKDLFYRKRHINIDEYCTFLNMGIQTCIAGLHILQIVAIFVTPYLCTRWGRKLTVIVSSLTMFIGIILITWFPATSIACCGFVMQSIGIGLASKVCLTKYVSNSNWSIYLNYGILLCVIEE